MTAEKIKRDFAGRERLCESSDPAGEEQLIGIQSAPSLDESPPARGRNMSWLITSPPNWAGSTGILLVRVLVGFAFVLHGWPKIQNATGWMNEMPNAPPAFLQAVAAFIEFAGGILLIAGFLTRVASVLLASQMVAALALVHIPHGDPLVGKPGQSSAELACVYLAISVLVAIVGPGLWSVDALLFGPRDEVAVEDAIRSPIQSGPLPHHAPAPA